jgi:hypothetical protein
VILRITLGAACAVAMVLPPARADEGYKPPPVGAQMTYRMISTTKSGDQSITTGQVYTYTITAVDGARSEGTIRPVALIYGCAADDKRPDCIVASRIAGAKRDGELLTVPVPDAVADNLAKQSRYAGRYFIVAERTFPMPGPKNPDDLENAEIGDTPIFLMSTRLDCDDAPLKEFFPLGKTPKVTLNCQNGVSRSRSRIAGVGDVARDEQMAMELTALGSDKQKLPSGEWDVQKIGVRFIPADEPNTHFDGEYDIALDVGMPVRTHTVVTNDKMKLRTEIDSQLIAYKP